MFEISSRIPSPLSASLSAPLSTPFGSGPGPLPRVRATRAHLAGCWTGGQPAPLATTSNQHRLGRAALRILQTTAGLWRQPVTAPAGRFSLIATSVTATRLDR